MHAPKTALLLVLTCASCSRSSGDRPADPTAAASTTAAPSAAPSVSSPAAPSSTPAVAAEPAPPPPLPALHTRMPLPATPYDPDGPSSTPAVHMTAVGDPAANAPAGTVFVTEQTGGRSSPLVLTEWDLAAGKALQHTTLPLEPDVTLAPLHPSQLLAVLGWGPDAATTHNGTFMMLGPTLKVIARSPIKSFGGLVQAIAGDDALVAVLYSEYTPDGANEVTRTFAATWTSTGKPIAQRALDPIGQSIERGSPFVIDNAVVTEGALFVLHHALGATHILHLSPDLQQLGDRVLARGHFKPVRLRVWRDHLVADVGQESFTVSLDLEQIDRVPEGPQRPPTLTRPDHDRVFMHGVQAELGSEADGKKRTNWVAWDRVGP